MKYTTTIPCLHLAGLLTTGCVGRLVVDGSHFYGTFTRDEVHSSWSGGLHADLAWICP